MHFIMYLSVFIQGLHLSVCICMYHLYLSLSVCTRSGTTPTRYNFSLFHIFSYLQLCSVTCVEFDSAGWCSSPNDEKGILSIFLLLSPAVPASGDHIWFNITSSLWLSKHLTALPIRVYTLIHIGYIQIHTGTYR